MRQKYVTTLLKSKENEPKRENRRRLKVGEKRKGKERREGVRKGNSSG